MKNQKEKSMVWGIVERQNAVKRFYFKLAPPVSDGLTRDASYEYIGLTTCLILARQMGHVVKQMAHELQVAACRHGKKTISISLSMQTAHVRKFTLIFSFEECFETFSLFLFGVVFCKVMALL